MPDQTQLLTTFHPSVCIAGNYHPRLSDDLVQLEIEETLSAPARCRATFVNFSNGSDGRPDYTYFDLNDFDFGRDLSIFSGVPQDTHYRMFHGRINYIGAQYNEHLPPEIVIEGEDAFQELRMKERTRTFEEVNDEDIIQQIASEYGLSAEISLDSPMHGCIKQLNQSDFAFLTDRVRAAGGVMWMEPTKLIVKKEADAQANPEVLEYGASLRQFVVQGDLRNQCTSVGVAGWDIRSKTPIRENATDTIPASANTGKTGGRAFEEAFGQRLQTLVHDMPDSSEEAKHLAETYYREKAGQFVTGAGIAEPLPGLHVGRTVNIRGVGKLFEGIYVVTNVRHRFNTTDGLRTEFNVRRAWIGEIKQIIKEKNHAGKNKRKKREAATRK